MRTRLIWDEAKRKRNLAKHGLDFADAWWVLESHYRLDVPVVRTGELRTQSLSYVLDRLAVLLLVHVPGKDAMRIVSFRCASELESENYYVWIEEEASDAPPDARADS